MAWDAETYCFDAKIWLNWAANFPKSDDTFRVLELASEVFVAPLFKRTSAEPDVYVANHMNSRP